MSTWWAGEGRRRRGGRGRRAGTPAQARPRLHPPAPTSSRPLDILRRQLLRSTRARACARARVTRWALPRPMDYLLTTYHISTPSCPLSLPCADLTTLHQCPFKSALGRLRLPKCGHDKKRPSSGGSRTNTATTDLTQHHYSREPHQPAPVRTNPTSTLPLHYPGIYKASAWVRAPGGSTTAPSAPTRKGAGGGGLPTVGISTLALRVPTLVQYEERTDRLTDDRLTAEADVV